MSTHDRGQVPDSAAEIYERFFVPALFSQWPPIILAEADVQSGDRLLDVACGTGVLAREALKTVGDSGNVVGIDINDGMLAVARSKPSRINWINGAAESLPFETHSFDRVVSQFGLMFFQDPTTAITEMLRVLRPGGKLAVAVWASLDSTPGYAAVAKLLRDLFGSDVAKSIEVPYCLGDTATLKALFSQAGADEIIIRTVEGKAHFASIESWIYTDIKGWTLADHIGDADYDRLKQAALNTLSGFVCPDGSVEFASPAHIVTIAR